MLDLQSGINNLFSGLEHARCLFVHLLTISKWDTVQVQGTSSCYQYVTGTDSHNFKFADRVQVL